MAKLPSLAAISIANFLDERDDVFADILTGLDQGSPAGLHTWMRDFNPGRG